jgi:hypothetical protein
VGLRDLFSRGGGGSRPKDKLDKLVKVATNPYTQSPERYNAMQQLMNIAADDDEKMVRAYVGVLKRFTISSTKSIEDEEEKGWAYRRLSAIGKPLLPALQEFCLEAENVAWALRILEDVANEEEEWALLDKLLERHPPGYERDPAKKIQVLTHVQEIDDPEVPKIMARYLGDDDETVRYFAVEALIDIGDETSKSELIGRLTDEKEDSIRLRARVLDGLATLGWDISDVLEDVAANIGKEHEIRGGKVVRR